MNHTPGPWTLDGGTILVRHKGVIARTPTPREDGVFEMVANARLIAAAPDLLAALHGLLVAVPINRNDEDELRFAHAIAAINKARGPQ